MVIQFFAALVFAAVAAGTPNLPATQGSSVRASGPPLSHPGLRHVPPRSAGIRSPASRVESASRRLASCRPAGPRHAASTRLAPAGHGGVATRRDRPSARCAENRRRSGRRQKARRKKARRQEARRAVANGCPPGGARGRTGRSGRCPGVVAQRGRGAKPSGHARRLAAQFELAGGHNAAVRRRNGARGAVAGSALGAGDPSGARGRCAWISRLDPVVRKASRRESQHARRGALRPARVALSRSGGPRPAADRPSRSPAQR